MRRLLAMTIGLALLLMVAPASAAPDVTQWRYARRISEGPPGPTVIELDGQALEATLADLGDLRVVDADKREVPWLELVPASRATVRYPVRIIDATTDPANDRSSFVCDLGEAGRVTNQVTLTTSSHDFFKKLSFQISNDLKAWQVLKSAPCYIYDLSGSDGGAQLTASYPETSYRYLRVMVADFGTSPLADLGAELHRYVPVERDEKPVPATCLAQGSDAGGAWTVLDLGYSNISPVRFRISTQAEAFQRPATVEGSVDRVDWAPVAQGTVYRTTEGEELAIPVSEPAAVAFRFYRLTIHTGDDTPLMPELVTAYAVPRRVIFERAGNSQLFLLYGNPGAAAPRYDLGRLSRLDPAQAATATFGRQLTVMTEPEVVTPPAAPPKTDADPRYWRFERPIITNATGFTEVPVDGRIHDGARPDLSDLRLVDDAGSAVPYQIRRSGDAVPLTFRNANRGVNGQEAWWVLDLGARNTPSHLVRVASDGTNFTRAARIDGSNDGESWSAVIEGTIRRAETIFGREDNLVLSYPEARYRYLRVSIQGESGEFEPSDVRGFPETILFSAQPGRQYRLYYGNPEAPVVTYPAQLFVDAYHPVTLSADALGREADHHPPAKLPWFLKPGEGPGANNPANRALTYLLWAILIALIGGMAALVVTVFRRLSQRMER